MLEYRKKVVKCESDGDTILIEAHDLGNDWVNNNTFKNQLEFLEDYSRHEKTCSHSDFSENALERIAVKNVEGVK